VTGVAELDGDVENALSIFASVFSSAKLDANHRRVQDRFAARLDTNSLGVLALISAVGASVDHPVAEEIRERFGTIFVIPEHTTYAWDRARTLEAWLKTVYFREAVARWTELAKIPAEYARELTW
jgi:hypothetical protein